jgi:hypothetical protein
MTPLQSWLLVIAVVATVTVAIIIIWTIIDLAIFAIQLERVRRATEHRRNQAHKLWLNSIYSKTARRNGHEPYVGSAAWVARQSSHPAPDATETTDQATRDDPDRPEASGGA